ncbi:sortase [Candidatus Microgenomates bacterium]|nr:sortase [Candidatus Microgenomates bacterium]
MFWLRLLAIFLIIGGGLVLTSAVFPIISYELFTAPNFSRGDSDSKFLSPVGDSNSQKYSPVDLTRASNWFVGSLDFPDRPEANSQIKYYTLSIPKLKISQATVEIAGEDLSKNLIHYKGTAIPGRVGNAVIFGHSTLPQFFSPTNYLSIFSTLPTLAKGDEIIVSYDGITYRFVISEMFEVAPTEISVLAQPNDKPHLTLITCVPPGTYLRRLIVKAELAPMQSGASI